MLKYGPYSPSRLETAMCPYAFYRQYIDPKRQKNSENLPQARGSVVHEVFEKITEYHIRKEIAPRPMVKKWIQESIDKHPAAYQEFDKIISMCDAYSSKAPHSLVSDSQIELKMAVKLVKNPDGTYQAFDDVKSIPGKTISRFRFVECGYDDPDAMFRGRADIFSISDDTTTASIVDHKTQMNIDEADTFQLGCYAWVAWICHPFLSKINTQLHFAQFNKYSQWYEWTPEQLVEIEDEIVSRIEYIEAKKDFGSAQSNKNCNYCNMLDDCPIKKGIVYTDPATGKECLSRPHNGALTSVQDAVDTAARINMLEQFVSAEKKKLKEYVGTYGPVAIVGKIYRFKVEEKVDFEKASKSPSVREKYETICAEHNINPTWFMSFSSTSTNNVWLSEDQKFVEKLSTLFPRRTEKEFRGEKI